jgi:hypothetical protein
MLLLFDDCIDFSNTCYGYGTGWVLLIEPNFVNSSILYSNVSLLVRKYHNEITDHDYFDSGSAFYAVLFASAELENLEFVRLILGIDPRAVDSVGRFDMSITHELVLTRCRLTTRYEEFFDLLVDRGVDLHQVCLDQTPTSLSMWFSGLFGPWRDLLRGLPQDKRKAYLQYETSRSLLPLKEAGWCPARLQELIDLPLEFHFEDFQYYNDTGDYLFQAFCHRCSGIGTGAMIEPWWEELKDRVKEKD